MAAGSRATTRSIRKRLTGTRRTPAFATSFNRRPLTAPVTVASSLTLRRGGTTDTSRTSGGRVSIVRGTKYEIESDGALTTIVAR